MGDDRYPITIHPWQRIPCAVCGTEYLGARGEPVVAEGPEDETCGDCQLYERAYREGLEAGRKEVLDRLRPIIHMISDPLEQG